MGDAVHRASKAAAALEGKSLNQYLLDAIYAKNNQTLIAIAENQRKKEKKTK